MNYKKHYDNLILKAQNRNLNKSIYVEQHHIIPKCLGGVNRKSNLVLLLPHEHFVAHQLLVKINPTHAGLKYALFKMTLSTAKMKRNNKQYGWIKKQLSDVNSINAIARWKNNQIEKDIYSKRTKKQWEDMSLEDYTTACNLRSINQTGSGNSFYGKTHKQSSKNEISKFRENYYKSMSDQDRIDKITQLRRVSINGIVYPGLSYASKMIGISPPLLHYRINSKSVKWGIYTYAD